jgi:hypothetical protein
MSDPITVYEDADVGDSAQAGGLQFETEEERKAHQERKTQMVARRNAESKVSEAKFANPAYLNFAAAKQAQGLYRKVSEREQAYIKALGLSGPYDPRHIRWMR